MICYRCNHEAGMEDLCPICGADLSVFKKITHLSNAYYNDGLQKAQVRNLSGAIVSLKKSLKFDKYNTKARNLLGLVYYEMGEIVDALSEWVISRNYQEEDNIADRYLEEIRENRGQLEAINQTIKKYNQALLYCHQDSRDLAIIQLKKVLSLNPKLVKAHQLLALLYIQEDKLDQAKKELRSAGKIDADNTITLRYLKEVNARLKERNKGKKPKEDDLISYQSGNETIIMPKHFQDTSIGSTLLYLCIGLVIGGLIIGFLAIPEIRKQEAVNWNQKLIDINESLSSKDTTIRGLEAQIAELQKQLEAAGDKIGSTPEETEATDALFAALGSYLAQDPITAGTTLTTIDTTKLKDNTKAIYDSLWTQVGQEYYSSFYDAGYTAYKGGNYQEAIEKLLSVVNFELDYKDGYAAYYLAQSYRKSGDVEAARPYYQHVIDNYPDTERAKTARKYVNN